MNYYRRHKSSADRNVSLSRLRSSGSKFRVFIPLYGSQSLPGFLGIERWVRPDKEDGAGHERFSDG